MRLLETMRYLTFEVNKDCNMAAVHPKCPVSDRERFMYGDQPVLGGITDNIIMSFWAWCRVEHGFQGIILWHLYNEPSLAIDRIEGLMKAMRAIEPSQRFHLWTNSPSKKLQLYGFNHVQHTDYSHVRPEDLDNRWASTRGEGKPYAEMEPTGECTRSFGWELIIDYWGNWLLCCNDWRCEESVGNIKLDEWGMLLRAFHESAQIRWGGPETWAALPRMCRSCITVNPSLHRSAAPPPGVTL